MANVSGKNDNFRRTWDREEYEKKAKERAEELEDDEDNDEDESSSKRRPSAPVKRELLKRRDYDVDLEANLGKSVVITKTTPLSHTGGYYCNVCDCVVKDSVNFLDHINGKKHQRNLGMSMRVERSSLDQVQRRFELNKRKREEEKQKKGKEYDLEERMTVLREEVIIYPSNRDINMHSPAPLQGIPQEFRHLFFSPRGWQFDIRGCYWSGIPHIIWESLSII